MTELSKRETFESAPKNKNGDLLLEEHHPRLLRIGSEDATANTWVLILSAEDEDMFMHDPKIKKSFSVTNIRLDSTAWMDYTYNPANFRHTDSDGNEGVQGFVVDDGQRRLDGRNTFYGPFQTPAKAGRFLYEEDIVNMDARLIKTTLCNKSLLERLRALAVADDETAAVAATTTAAPTKPDPAGKAKAGRKRKRARRQ